MEKILFTFSLLLPSWFVNVQIKAMAKNGLCVTFMNNFFHDSIKLGPHIGGHYAKLMSSTISSNNDSENHNKDDYNDEKKTILKAYDNNDNDDQQKTKVNGNNTDMAMMMMMGQLQ